MTSGVPSSTGGVLSSTWGWERGRLGLLAGGFLLRDDGGEAGMWESKSKALDLVDLVDILFPVPAGSLARRAEPLPIVSVR